MVLIILETNWKFPTTCSVLSELVPIHLSSPILCLSPRLTGSRHIGVLEGFGKSQRHVLLGISVPVLLLPNLMLLSQLFPRCLILFQLLVTSLTTITFPGLLSPYTHITTQIISRAVSFLLSVSLWPNKLFIKTRNFIFVFHVPSTQNTAWLPVAARSLSAD